MNLLAQLIAYRQKPQEFERMENVFQKRHKEQHKRKFQSETLDRHDSSAADSRCIAGRMRHTGKRSGNGTDCITVRPLQQIRKMDPLPKTLRKGKLL